MCNRYFTKVVYQRQSDWEKKWLNEPVGGGGKSGEQEQWKRRKGCVKGRKVKTLTEGLIQRAE
jgi:hypothetical protein